MSSPITFAEYQDGGPAQQALGLPIQPVEVVSEEQVISQATQRLFSPNVRSKHTLAPFDPHVSPQAPKAVARALLRPKDSNSCCAITNLVDDQPKGNENQQRESTSKVPGTGTLPARTHGNRSWEPLLVGKQSLTMSLLEDVGNSPDFPPDNVITDELLEDSPTPRAGRREPPGPNLHEPSATLSFQPLLPSSCIDRFQDIPRSEQTHGRIANVSGLRDNTDDFGSAAQLESQPTSRAELPISPGDTNGLDLALENTSHTRMTHDKNQANVTSERPIRKPDLFFDAPSDPVQGVEETDNQDRMEIQDPGQTETENCKANHSAGPIATVEESIVHEREDSRAQSYQDTRDGKSENSRLADSLSGAGEPYTGADEEQVQAQLFREIEQASSQGDTKVQEKNPNQELASRRTRKRKESFATKDRPNKLAKAPASPNFEVVVESRKLDEDGDTSILIDTRPATSDQHGASPMTGYHTRSMSNRQNLDIQYDSSPSRRGVPSSDRNGPTMSNRIDRIPHINWQRKRRYEKEEPQNGNRGVAPRLTKKPHIDRQNKSCSMTRGPGSGLSTVQPQAQSISTPWQKDQARALGLRVDTHQPAKQHGYGDHEVGASFVSEGDTIPDTPVEEDGTAAAAAAVAPGDVLLPPDALLGKGPAPTSTLLGQWPSMGSILGGFRSLVDQVKRIRLQPAEQREMTEMAFEMIREAQEAGRRTGGV